MKLLIIIISVFQFEIGYSMDQAACSKMLNNGLYKTYRYGGIDQPLTKATKDHGATKSTSVTTTEGTTASLDPKYWSNITTSETQSSSSSGECSLIGLKNLEKARESYIAQNKDELFNDIARGDGEFLNVLAAMSLCDESAVSDFGSALRKDISNLIYKNEGKRFGSVVDSSVRDSSLDGRCYNYSL